MINLKIDASALTNIGRAYEEAGKDAPKIISRALNHTGDKALTKVRRVIRKETGLAKDKVDEAVTKRSAYHSRLIYEITGKGGAHPLRDFGARQTQRGVSAAPWKRRQLFAGTFLVPSLGGHVFHRTGRERLPIEKLYGPSIPREMIRGESFATLQREIDENLAARLLHELARTIG